MDKVLGFVKRYVALMVLAIIVIGAGLAFCMSDIYVSGTWRYKITVIVETPEGIKSGSSVYEMSNTDSSIKLDLPEAGNPATIRGEAIVVDLGSRGVVFGLIPSESLLYSAITVPNGGATTPKGIRYYKNLKNVSATLKTNEYPIMVTFKDMKDPKTVELAYQAEAINTQNQTHYDYKITDNFETLFGKGVKLKDIIIKMTGEPVTWGVVDRYLPSFDANGYREWAGGLPYGDPRAVDKRNFQSGK